MDELALQKQNLIYQNLPKKGLVVYKNQMNQICMGNIGAKYQDLVMLIFSQIKDSLLEDTSTPVMEGFGSIILDGYEVRKIAGYKGHHTKSEFDAFLDEFWKNIKEFDYLYDNGIHRINGVLFPALGYDRETDKIQVMYTPLLHDFLEQTDREFTRFLLEDHCKISGKHTKPLFRLLMQWNGSNMTRWYEMNELRLLLGYSEDYPVKKFVQEIGSGIEEITSKKILKKIQAEYQRANTKGAPIAKVRFRFR